MFRRMGQRIAKSSAPQPPHRLRAAAHASRPSQAQAAPRPFEVVATRPGLGRRFAGQLDEEVLFSRHPSPYVLLRPAWLLLLDLALLGALVYWQFHTPKGAAMQAGTLHGAEMLVGMLLVPLIVYWLARGVVPWLAHVFVLTNQRLIEYSGVWRRTRKQLALEHIQQVRVERPSFLAALLDLGDVIVLTASEDSDLRLVGVRSPRAVADAIVRMRPGGAGSRPSRPAIPEGLHPTVQALMEQVTGRAHTPESSASAAFPAAGPHRAPIRLLPGEQVLTVIHRHWYLLLRRIVGPLVLLLAGLLSAAIVMALAGRTMSLLAVVLMLGSLLPGLVWGVLAYLNYIDDIFILTTDRIVDIERRYFLLAEARREAPYDRIQDVRVKVEGSGRVLGFGALTIETAGRLPDIDLRYVPQAFAVQDLIFARINALKERSASSAVSRQRDEYAQMMASTINQLLIEVPDIRGMSVLEAGERIRAAGLTMVVQAQQEARGVPPGLVIAQAPGAGTLEVRGNEVLVVLSGRATPAASAAPAAPLWPAGG